MFLKSIRFICLFISYMFVFLLAIVYILLYIYFSNNIYLFSILFIFIELLKWVHFPVMDVIKSIWSSEMERNKVQILHSVPKQSFRVSIHCSANFWLFNCACFKQHLLQFQKPGAIISPSHTDAHTHISSVTHNATSGLWF